MKTAQSLHIALAALSCLALTACDPDDIASRHSAPLSINTVASAPKNVINFAPSRADLTGYSLISGVNDGEELTLYMPSSSDANKKHVFTYDKTSGGWGSTDAKAENGKTYDLFGYKPTQCFADDGEATFTYGGSSASTLSLTGISAANAYDICFVVAAGPSLTAVDTPADPPAFGTFGFTYDQSIMGNKPAATLVMDHLFAQIQFQFKLDPEYAKLRQIYLKRVTLRTSSVATVDVEITLTPNSTGTKVADSDITWESHTVTDPTDGIASEADLFAADVNMPFLLPTDHYEPIPGYLCPLASGAGMNYSIEVEYDVYAADVLPEQITAGTVEPIREDQKAVNKWPSAGKDHVQRGKKYTISCLVKPTYLYQLADEDLDIPTFEFASEPIPEGDIDGTFGKSGYGGSNVN